MSDTPNTRPLALTKEQVKDIVREYAQSERSEIKSAFKEAIKEWLAERYATFGKWTLRSLFATLIAWLAYFYLVSHGWSPPK
jgi:hypothetical protein